MSHQRADEGPGRRRPSTAAGGRGSLLTGRTGAPSQDCRPARTRRRRLDDPDGAAGRPAACCSSGRLHAARGRQLQPHVPERRQCRAVLDLRGQPCGAHAPGSAARPRHRRRFRGLGRRLGAGDRHRGLGGARRDQAASRRGGRGAGRAAPRRPRPGTAPDRAHAPGRGCLLVDHRRRGLGRAAEHRRRIPPGRRCSVSAWPDSPPRSRESPP